MVFESKCKFLGEENRLSKKGNEYLVVTVMQGIDVLTIMSDVEINSDFGKEFVGVFNYDVRFKNLRLVGAK